MSFIDSPEYIARHTARGAVFTVRVIALPPPLPPSSPPPALLPSSSSLPLPPPLTPSTTACTILSFPYSHLTSPPTHPHLLSTLDALVSRDVTDKLFTTGEVVRGLVKLRAMMQGEGRRLERGEEGGEKEEEKDEEKVEGGGWKGVWSEAAVRLTSAQGEWT